MASSLSVVVAVLCPTGNVDGVLLGTKVLVFSGVTELVLCGCGSVIVSVELVTPVSTGTPLAADVGVLLLLVKDIKFTQLF